MQAPLTGLRQEALAKPGSYTHASASMPGFVIPLPVSVSTGRGRGRGRGQGFCTGHHGTSTYSWAGRGRSEHFQMGHCQGLSRLFSSKAARSCLYNRASTSDRGRAGSLHFIHKQAPQGPPKHTPIRCIPNPTSLWQWEDTEKPHTPVYSHSSSIVVLVFANSPSASKGQLQISTHSTLAATHRRAGCKTF